MEVITAMRQVFLDDINSFEKQKSELSVDEFTYCIRQTAAIYKPLLTLGLHKKASELNERSSLEDLYVITDTLCMDLVSSLREPDKVMEMAHRVCEIKQTDIYLRALRLARGLLKAMLDAHK